MSLQTFLNTVESDIQSAFTNVEAEAEKALLDVWDTAKTVFISAEPTIVSDVLAGIKTFLGTAAADIAGGKPLEDLEQDFLEWGQGAAPMIVAGAQSLGSRLIQALLALAIKAL